METEVSTRSEVILSVVLNRDEDRLFPLVPGNVTHVQEKLKNMKGGQGREGQLSSWTLLLSGSLRRVRLSHLAEQKWEKTASVRPLPS